MSPLISLKSAEAEALHRELGHCDDPALDTVKAKVAAAVAPEVHQPIPGQTTIDEQIERAA